ncbi:MAG: radical SAM family heme chaperone HemW [Bacteroidetes bacterium]|nr:radical SAM family heme chaperone HemW [Bacteroidota bacterium]MBP6401228.1 radical SAM family heme chaperone HemW [Bacteroidia bacterium]MBK9523767.1 radical SAM family heme chaperone HemW [Bacteroidota bacterium]MBK9541519.1 radical SAM family heme chaperone HemW [Bacteroidota bacterium]MBL0258611.1 radical SAM family heme chaperone HemW [Bacteroidota bacterium]
MPGLYLHIPFCKQACNYCDFHFSTTHNTKSAMLEAMRKEIGLRSDYLGTNQLNTIYFGGGTPSLLTGDELKGIFETIHRNFSVDPDAEITLEANPDDITAERLDEFRIAGINRLSIGIQSFSDEDLKYLNRVHSAQQAIDAVKLAQAHGFNNISIDLIYGIPTLSEEQWEQNMETAFSLNVNHLSCYSLTVEPRTALAKLIKDRKVTEVDDEMSAIHFAMLMDRASWAGYEHYEISNFAKPGHYSRHNTSYWNGEPYLGIGPSAHSYNKVSRQWNISNNPQYIRSIDESIVPFEREELTDTEKFNEYILTSLRTIWGISLRKLFLEFGEKSAMEFQRNIIPLLDDEQIELQGENLVLTRRGKFFADRIAADLFQ